MKRWLAVLWLGLWGCLSDPGWDRRVASIEATLARAEADGAMRCAPRELALSRAHLSFAVFERERGHHDRAQEHLAVAEPNANAAAYLSPRERCSDDPNAALAEQTSGDEPPRASSTAHGADTEQTDARATDAERADAGPSGAGSTTDPAPGAPAHAAEEGSVPASSAGEPTPPQADAADAAQAVVEASPPDDSAAVAPAPPPSDQDADGVPDRDDECPLVPGEAGSACPSGYPGLVVRAQRIVLLRPVTLDHLGAPDEPTRVLLGSIVQALHDRPAMRIEVGAHTDAEGTDLQNLAESQRRAERVRSLLVEAGADGGRILARGYGEELPLESNSTPEGRAANRRIEIRRLEEGAAGASALERLP